MHKYMHIKCRLWYRFRLGLTSKDRRSKVKQRPCILHSHLQKKRDQTNNNKDTYVSVLMKKFNSITL